MELDKQLGVTTTPISSTAVSTTTVAPSEKPESDAAAITRDTASPSSISTATTPSNQLPSLIDMDGIDQDSVSVVNMPSQTSTSSTAEDEMPAIPSVRNNNPVIYRTVAQNDRALIRF